MKIIKVKRRSDWRKFHAVLDRIYGDVDHYIAPLESDVEGVFNPRKNKVFEHGDAACFVLLDENDRPLGRIAAFVDHRRNELNDFPVGGIGFFECINDAEAARRLFARAEEYLAQWQVRAIDGPINFGERDKFWGLLVKGDEAPLYQENYHPGYYRRFFDRMGFEPYEQILTFHGKIEEVPIERFSQIAQRIRKRYNLHTVRLSESNMNTFARHFSQVYNVAFRDNPYFKPLSPAIILKIFKQLRLIADLNMVAITYQKDRPIALAGFIPDINPFLKPFKGRLNLLRIPLFLWRLKSAKKRLLKGIAFGIDPDYQRIGAFAVLIDALYNEHLRRRYSDFYLATIRGHNSVMIKSIKNLGVETQRVHLAFRKMLDPRLPLDPFAFSPED